MNRMRQDTPFDDSATARLARMGLLNPNGQPQVDAVNVVARLYAGLYYDALSDACEDQERVAATCAELASLLGTISPRQLFLQICLRHDDIHRDLPEPVWRLSGDMALVRLFSEGFVRQLGELAEEVM